MFIRFVLVGAVSCLGLDARALPDLTPGAAAPRCVWCLGAAAQASAADPDPAPVLPMPNGDQAFAPVTEGPTPAVETAPVAQPDRDLDFGAALAATLQQFEEDFAALQPRPEPLEPALAVAAPEPPAPAPEAAEPVQDDLYPGLAFALNREAEGIGPPPVPQAEPIASHTYWELTIESDAALVPEIEPALVAAAEPPAVEPSQERRIEEAVRLTGQAIHAWLSVLQAPSVALDAPSDTLSR